MNAYIFIDDDTLSLSINNKAYNVTSDHPKWDDIVSSVAAGEYDVIPALINQTMAIADYVTTDNNDLSVIDVDVENAVIRYAGAIVHNALVDHIFDMKDQGFNITPMIRFMDNLFQNPRKKAVDELYSFLQHGKMPITEDGHFIAYKRVGGDYKSLHDHTTDNSIGTILSMPRNLVDDDSAQTCSTGLHFCSHEYLKAFGNCGGNRVVILKINPRDVVSIPADYNDTKGRACQYEVVGELSPEDAERALTANVFVDAVHNGNAPAAKPTPKATEPKTGSTPFFQGYSAGWAAGFNDGDYNDYTLFAGKHRMDYTEGYDKGFTDGLSSDTEKYRFVAEQPAQSLGDLLHQKIYGTPSVGPKTGTTPFYDGYNTGYSDNVNQDDYDADNDYMLYDDDKNYREGYDKGWDDSHNNFSRRYLYIG